MIDLIIPYYNNRAGLIRTLNSILTPDIFYITIVDDNADITPYNPKANQVLRYNRNSGPGYARQFGLDRTHNKWVMFIDTGDIFLGQESFEAIIRALEEYSDANVISFSYLYKGNPVNETSNRLHGKIYKRAFLEKYDITFAPESSYLNEDIGFNRTCRLLTDIVYEKTPIIKWIEESDSLTHKDNQASLYRDQTRALSLVSIHTIETCRKNNVDPAPEINQIAIALYYWFIRTVAERSMYIQDAWAGARIFYKQYEKDIHLNQLLLGNVYMKKCLLYRNQISFSINILRFADDIIKNEILPDKYLTFNQI